MGKSPVKGNGENRNKLVVVVVYLTWSVITIIFKKKQGLIFVIKHLQTQNMIY